MRYAAHMNGGVISMAGRGMSYQSADPRTASPSPFFARHPNAMANIYHAPNLQGQGFWDFLDPQKNGVSAAFEPVAQAFKPSGAIAKEFSPTGAIAQAFKPHGKAQEFGEQVGQTLRNNIRPIIHTGVGSAISYGLGDPTGLSGAVIGRAGLNRGIDEGLDKANLGFGLNKKGARRFVKGSKEAKDYMASIRRKKSGMRGGMIPAPPSRSYITDPSLIGRGMY